jgi:hypothetical protein
MVIGAIGVTTIPVLIFGCVGVLKTGQTTCYDITSSNVIACAGTGQDGEFQKGTARSYTSNADGTITDNSTGLMWEKLTNPGDGSIHDWNNTYSWAQAFVKIAALNTVPCFANHCDWRLPNINELETLLDYGLVNPCIAPVFNNGVDSFTNSTTLYYWSSTPHQADPDIVWGVNFFDGGKFPSVSSQEFYVRAVRGSS